MKWLGRAAGVVLAAVTLLVLAGWVVLRASLPELDGRLEVAGIDDVVTIERDGNGIPEITAANRADVAFATGYVHGQDRFFQMDLLRRQAAGELSELVGAAALDVDKRHRLHRFRVRAQRAYDAASARERALVDAYSAGVNAGLASLGARPFEYLVLGAEPRDWEPADSLLVVYTMYLQLNDARADNDIRRGLASRVLPAKVYAWLYPQGTSWDAPLMGAPREPQPIPAAEIYTIRDVVNEAPPANESGRGSLLGSNNWVVAGALTASGKALVANDMHLGLGVPNIWYRARLRVQGGDPVDVSGVTLPGSPFIVAGSNTHVAWGFTNSYGDWSDAVLLQPGSVPGTYRAPGGEQEFKVFTETIRVKDGDPVELRVRETIWGPVVDDVDYPDGDIAVSWVAHKPGSVNLRILELETAKNVEEALDIANTMALPAQNFVTGDAGGNIGWTIAGRIPRRADFDGTLPADWSVEHGWQGWYEPGDYPRIVNPESGRIWTANARVADAEALRIIGDGGYALGARARQIRDALLASDTFTPADMLAIQYDNRAIFLSRWRDLLLEVLDEETIAGRPDLAEYRELVATWVPRAAPESVGYRLVRAFRLEVQRRVFHALMAPVRAAYGDDIELRRSNQFEGPLWSLVTVRPPHLLPANYDSWQALMLAAVEQNIVWFDENFDGPLAERTWGERNTASIRHPLSRAIPLLGGYLDMSADQLNGDRDMPLAQGPGFGASERFAVSPGDEAGSILHMPTGQSGHPLSAYYGQGHEDWVRGRSSPFLPGEALHSLTLTPDRR
jgi:penicillin G amidase